MSIIMDKRQMFLTGMTAALLMVLTCKGCNAINKMQNTSFEYKLRRDLLTSYDRFVRPVLSPLTIVNVSFSVRLVSLINADNKQQMVTSKVLIKQSWHNPFLTWDQANFGGIDRIRMSKNEVWVPDITLHNNANNPSLQTQHHYENWVTVYSNGTNVWVSLAMLDSECNIDVNRFPFDYQTCWFDFASESYDASSLDIHLMKGLTDGYTYMQKQRHFKTISNGEWRITNETTQRIKEENECCSIPFVHVKLELMIKRIPTFYVLYLICPCVVLSLLVFFSFVIPPENGERLGFCSSLLLSLSVYLLLFSDLIPQNSRNVSLLGVVFVFIFLEAALALMSTVLVLKAYHATSKVPTFIKFLFLCECGFKMKKEKPKRNQIIPRLPALKEEEPPMIITSEIDRETGSLAKLGQNEEEEQKEIVEEEQNQAEENQRSWLKVARKLDRLFFWSFLICLIGSLGIVLLFSEYLEELNIDY